MRDAPDLRSLQTWMQDAIRDPLGPDAPLTTGDTDGRGRAPVEEMIVGTPPLGALERLDLYSRQFRSRMLTCLRETYPALRHALGNDLFDEFALAYVGERPSRSYTLHALRDGFAAYLKDTQGDMTGPDHHWADFVVELAGLEARFHVVYDGPGVEGESPRPLSLPPRDDWQTVVIDPHPSLQLMRARFPIATYFRAARRQEQPSLPRPAATFIAVTRRDYSVVLVDLDAARYKALEELRTGRSLGAVTESSSGLSQAELTKWLREWKEQALIVGVRSVRAEGEGGSAMEIRQDSILTTRAGRL